MQQLMLAAILFLHQVMEREYYVATLTIWYSLESRGMFQISLQPIIAAARLASHMWGVLRNQVQQCMQTQAKEACMLGLGLLLETVNHQTSQINQL